MRNLEGAAQEVPKELLDLAMQSSWFRKSRFKQGKAKALGGRGLGFRERPGLGSTPNETTGEDWYRLLCYSFSYFFFVIVAL